MNAEQAKKALGLEPTVSNDDALTEVIKKRIQVEEKLNNAPTDALKGKFQQMRASSMKSRPPSRQALLQ